MKGHRQPGVFATVPKRKYTNQSRPEGTSNSRIFCQKIVTFDRKRPNITQESENSRVCLEQKLKIDINDPRGGAKFDVKVKHGKS